MPVSPKTPSKADDGIERVKQVLSTKWGIRFPVRDTPTSPSKRNMDLVEEKISGLIQYLYFKDSALDYALKRFEENAVQISSHWQFKPRGEPDVLPSLAHSQSALKQDFLKRRHVFSPQEVAALTESLVKCLYDVRNRVQDGEKFLSSFRVEDNAIAMNDACPTRLNPSKTQLSPRQLLRSKSEPEATKIGGPPAHHPSSDDYLDHDSGELLANIGAAEQPLVLPIESIYARDVNKHAELEYSSSEDTFETPPSTPPSYPDLFEPFGARKRSCPDSIQTRPIRNVSRKISSDKSPQKSVYQHCRKTAGTVPQSDNTISMTMRTKLQPDYLRESAQNRSLEWEPTTLFGSFEDKPSISSSITNTSSAGTSTNTSFSATSLATSFDSSLDIPDTTAKVPSWSNIPRPPQWDYIAPGSENWVLNNFDNEGSNVLTAKTRAPPNLMDIDIDPTVASTTALQGDSVDFRGLIVSKTSQTDFRELLLARLRENPPFVQVPDHYPSAPLRQVYEITRVASACQLPISLFLNCFESTFASYDSLWSSLSSIARAHRTQVPERSSLAAWDRAGSDFEGVELSGKLTWLDQQKGPCLNFQLSPLKLDTSYRLSRKFGSDRFFVVGMPKLDPGYLPSYLKTNHTSALEAITRWLVDTNHNFLRRTWRAFNARMDKKIRARDKKRENLCRIHLFAEDGVGFRDAERSGEADPRFLDRPRMAVGDMIEWFMPFKANLKQPSLKFFARLALGLSRTMPTVMFSPAEIFRADDARADTPGPWRLSYKRSDEKKRQENPSKSQAPVMNDGCARISRSAARNIADRLGLDNVPCVFQARIGGAKGIWMIDAQDETPSQQGRNYWIEITDSQLKFQGHAQDDHHPEPARVTFEVTAGGWAKRLSSSSLNFQFLPILVDRGVPPDVLVKLLEQDLKAHVKELEVAMDSGMALRKWNHEKNCTTADRAEHGGIEMNGGLPSSTAEMINWFTEHGFEPNSCRYLKDQLYQTVKAYCDGLEKKMHIGLGQSTRAYMIADPLAVLQEGEIHLGFSSVFVDVKSGFNESMLHNMDVLVARSPAYLPSDIQKVRAVFKPELMMYRDVIVFSSRGSVSLASKLSGGDYDGDDAWVCWDPDIVRPFTNADVPLSPSLDFYGIEKDNTTVADISRSAEYMNTFLHKGFELNLQSDMLGKCSNYHEAYCYREQTISNQEAILIALLLGNLVDSAKAGYRFEPTKWDSFLKRYGLPPFLPSPAYEDQQKANPTKHLIDHLVFVVAKGVKDEALHEFDRKFPDVPTRDDDLFRLRNEEYAEAKRNMPLANVLKNLEAALENIKTFWAMNVTSRHPDSHIPSPRKRDTMSFRSLVEKCRADFVSLKPTLDESTLGGETSDRISSWQRDHELGRSSYWDLFKASVAFYNYHIGTFAWHVAGIELGEIKAKACGPGTYRTVYGKMFDAMKPDRRLIAAARRREMFEREGGSWIQEGNEEEEEDEYGDWDWGIDDC